MLLKPTIDIVPCPTIPAFILFFLILLACTYFGVLNNDAKAPASGFRPNYKTWKCARCYGPHRTLWTAIFFHPCYSRTVEDSGLFPKALSGVIS